MSSESDPSADWESAPSESPVAAPPVERSFFTFWRCCGCLALLGVAVTIAGVIGLGWVRDRAFMTEPLEIPVTEYTEAQVSEIEGRFETSFAAGEVVALTPEELTIFLTDSLRTGTELGERSAFHCAATPDGLLDARLTLEIPDTSEVPFFMRGRFINLAFVGNFTIEDGELTDAQFQSYQFGGFPGQTGVSDAESKQLMEELKKQSKFNPEVQTSLGRVKLFRFDGEKIEMAVEPR